MIEFEIEMHRSESSYRKMKQIHYSNFGKTYAPFSNPAFKSNLKALGFTESSLLRSDIVVCRNLRNARVASSILPFKQILVWTNEPRCDSSPAKQRRGILGQRLSVFNVFTENVFFHNSHFFASYHYDESNNLGITLEKLRPGSELIDAATFRKRKCLFGAFTRKEPAHFQLIVGKSENLDGNRLRQSLIEEAAKRGIGEVAGRGWGGLAIEDSGFSGSDESPWWTRKIELLSQYNFSIAIENTIFPYYVTEKIWQSIKAHSLPLYVGRGSSIYKSFPPNSFVDVSDFTSNRQILDFLTSMPYDEWLRRMDACIAVYNSQVEDPRNSTGNKLKEILSKIRELVD